MHDALSSPVLSKRGRFICAPQLFDPPAAEDRRFEGNLLDAEAIRMGLKVITNDFSPAVRVPCLLARLRRFVERANG